MSNQIPKLEEIAKRIRSHLERMENSQPTTHNRTNYCHATAWPAGRYIKVRYISYQYTWNLNKTDALKYLTWLDAGNEDKHMALKRESP